MDPEKPATFSGITTPDHYFEFRYKIQKAMEQVPEIARNVEEQFKARFGRSYGLIEKYGEKEAEVLLVTAGAMTGTARTVIEKMAEKGRMWGE